MVAPRNVRRLRVLLLSFLVVLVVGVFGLYLFGRAGREAARPTDLPTEEVRPELQEAAAVGSGFEYTFADGGVTIFKLRGRENRLDRSGRAFLEGVNLTYFTEDGSAYEVASESAVYDEEKTEALFDGNVRVKGPDGLELSTSKLELKGGGRILVAPERLRFRYGDLGVGAGDRLRANLRDDDFIVYGNVVLDSLPESEVPFGLSTERLYYHRDAHYVRADGAAQVRFEGSRIEAQRLDLLLADDERSPRSLVARREVTGQLGTTDEAGRPTVITFSGDQLSVAFVVETSEPSKFELEGSLFAPARLDTSTPGGAAAARHVTANFMVGRFEDGVLSSADAFGRVTLIDAPTGEAGLDSRQATAERAEASFDPDGTLSRLVLEDWVVFRSRDLTARGQKGVLNLAADTAEFDGDPVEINAESADLTAPRVFYTRQSGLLHATGGTRALLSESSEAFLAGGPLGSGGGPVWVESEEAFLREAPSGARFRGSVRAWRGQEVILADELTGDGEARTLGAEGNVRTLWRPPESTEPDEEEGPIEVTAESMAYGETDERLLYEGNVQAIQGGRTLACDALTVELDGEGEAEKLVCAGTARIEDPSTGRTVSGEVAVYQLADRTVEVTGEEVVMEDREGARMTGERLVYELDSGLVRVVTEPGDQAS